MKWATVKRKQVPLLYQLFSPKTWVNGMHCHSWFSTVTVILMVSFASFSGRGAYGQWNESLGANSSQVQWTTGPFSPATADAPSQGSLVFIPSRFPHDHCPFIGQTCVKKWSRPGYISPSRSPPPGLLSFLEDNVPHIKCVAGYLPNIGNAKSFFPFHSLNIHLGISMHWFPVDYYSPTQCH